MSTVTNVKHLMATDGSFQDFNWHLNFIIPIL